MIGTRQAMNIAARNTPRSVWPWIVGRRTEIGCLFRSVRTSSGQRKSFHEASTAKIDTTPRIGFDIGSTIDTNRRNGPAPSIRAASKISRGRLSKKRFIRTDVECARPGGQPDCPVAADEGTADQRRVHDLDVERHEQRHRGTNSVVSSSPGDHPARTSAAVPRARSLPVVATIAGIATSRRRSRPCSRSTGRRPRSSRPREMLLQPMPCGKTPSGWPACPASA